MSWKLGWTESVFPASSKHLKHFTEDIDCLGGLGVVKAGDQNRATMPIKTVELEGYCYIETRLYRRIMQGCLPLINGSLLTVKTRELGWF